MRTSCETSTPKESVCSDFSLTRGPAVCRPHWRLCRTSGSRTPPPTDRSGRPRHAHCRRTSCQPDELRLKNTHRRRDEIDIRQPSERLLMFYSDHKSLCSLRKGYKTKAYYHCKSHKPADPESYPGGSRSRPIRWLQSFV